MAGPVADRETEALLPVPTGEHTTAALVFHERTADRAVRLPTVLPALAALTACLACMFSGMGQQPRRPLSSPWPRLLWPTRFSCAPLQTPENAVFHSDSRWYHVCATWEQRSGHWALFNYGRQRAEARGLSVGHPVPPDGVLVLGQDQDSLGGGFSTSDAFSGNLIDFYLWDRVLSLKQVRCSCLHTPGACSFSGTQRPWTLRPHCCPPCLCACSALVAHWPEGPDAKSFP